VRRWAIGYRLSAIGYQLLALRLIGDETVSTGQQIDRSLEASPPALSQAWSRRGLLGAAGVSLAAGGLLLPVGLVEEAAADNHPARRIQRRKDRRRNKRHHQRRHSQHRQHHDHGRGGANQPLGIQFDIALNGGGSQIIGANFTVLTVDGYKTVGGKYLKPPSGTARFTTASYAARVDYYDLTIPYGFIFLVENSSQGLPILTMGHHGTFSEQGWTGGTIVFQQGMAVGELSPPMKIDGYSFRVTRLSDTKDHVVFSITAAPPIS